MACHSQTSTETVNINKYEEAVWASHDNRSLAEALKISKVKTQQPEKNYLELLLNLVPFAVLLHALFGDRCEYYVAVYEII